MTALDTPAELDDLRAEVRTVVEQWQDAGRALPSCDAWLRSYDLDFSRLLGQKGWLGITWPVAAGGGGRSNRARFVVTEELLRAGAPVAAHWIAERQIGPAILRYGSSELQAEYLSRIAGGEVTFCLGMSETESGSDLASVRTTAVLEDGQWRVDGRKIWTSQAHRSTHAYVLARTSRTERKHEGLTELLVDMASPGVEVRPIHDLRGEHHFNEVTFDGVLVPQDHVLGEVGQGWRQVTEQLSFERGGMERVLSTYPLLAAVVDAVGDRGTTGDEVAVELGRALARLFVLRRMAWDVAGALDRGEAPVQQAAVLKDLGTVFERDVIELARRVLDAEADPGVPGPEGLLAQGVLAAPGFSIRGGTTEVLRTIIARGAAVGSPRRSTGADELREVVDDVLAGRGGDPDDGMSPVWATVLELGWTGVGVSEGDGGAGGSLHDLAALAEGLGRHVVSVPLVETALATRVLTAAGRPAPEGVATVVVLPRPGERLLLTGAGAGQARTVSGTATRVPWAAHADLLVLLAEDETGADVALCVPATAAGVERRSGLNLAGEPRCTVVLSEVPVSHDAVLDGAPSAAEVRGLGALLRAAQLVGAIETAYEHTRRHVAVREQFGKPLIAFQAVAHQLAAIASELALARTALDAAVATWDSTPGDLDAVATARVVVGGAATEVARIAHQLHGAMGVTREHPLHLATRRLWSWRDEWGTEKQWAGSLGRALVPQGSHGIWTWLTRPSVHQEQEEIA
jgi:alkylation response protein AidB-like acyl-CoA dehydrogenase